MRGYGHHSLKFNNAVEHRKLVLLLKFLFIFLCIVSSSYHHRNDDISTGQLISRCQKYSVCLKSNKIMTCIGHIPETFSLMKYGLF